MSLKQDADEVMALVDAVKPFFAGKSSEVQITALSDLLAMWLASHICPGDAKATKRLREMLLQAHIHAVRGLIEVNYKTAVEPQFKQRTH